LYRGQRQRRESNRRVLDFMNSLLIAHDFPSREGLRERSYLVDEYTELMLLH
jgi:hypothetical protein